MTHARWVLLLVCGCLPPEPVEVPSANELDFDGIDRLFERTRRAFTQHGSELRGGDATTRTDVSIAGVSIRPYQWDSAGKREISTAPPLHLETVHVGRGMTVAALASAVRIADDGSAEILRGPTVEVLRNIHNGVEQSWRFEQRPSGAGDLIVQVAVSGHTFGGRTPTGLHFLDPATGLGFGYSDAVWIDASGNSHPVPAQMDGDSISLRVPGEIVDKSTYPAILDPSITAEYGFDTPLIGPSSGNQYAPDIAYSGVVGAEYLVVWTDYRREDSFDADIYGARVTATGAIVDPVGLQIASTNVVGDQINAKVVWTDDPAASYPHWMVIWQDTTDCGGLIRARKMRADAHMQAPDFDVSPRSCPGETNPDFAYNRLSGGMGARMVVTWQLSTGGVEAVACIADTSTGVCGAGIDPNTPSSVLVTSATSAQNPTVSAGDMLSDFVIAWSDASTGNNSNIFTRPMTSTLTMAAPSQLTSNLYAQIRPAIGIVAGL